ncbi:MAG: hypothetical protein KAR19_07140 [Bacteroidales bacterium]|nr:hypothetical protein [Bacteroidales bacterium]
MEIPAYSYWQNVNPHCDGTAGRALYEEFKTPLTGEAAIELNKWIRFKYEVVGTACHVYVADMNTPKVTFNYYHYSSGRVGFRPRSGGSEFWLDNVTIKTIEELSYKGPILPKSVSYSPDKLLTKWDVIGPFTKRMEGLEKMGYSPDEKYIEEDQEYKWKSFPTDNRGCVLSGRICDFQPPGRKLAYFHSIITSPKKKEVAIKFSSRSKLAIFINGKSTTTIRTAKYHKASNYFRVS